MEARGHKPWENTNKPQRQNFNNNNNNAQNKKKPVVEAHGVIGAVPSADRVVIYLNDNKEGGGKWVAPKKVEVKLSWVKAPKPHFLFINEETEEEEDQPQDDFFWEAREHLRRFAIGKPAKIEVRPNEDKLGNREIGSVQIKDGNKTVDLSQYVVPSGYADVVLPKNFQQGAEGTDNANTSSGGKGQDKRPPKPNENITKLVDLEKEAKNKNLGKYQSSKVNAQLEPLLDFNHKNKYAEWRGTDEKQKLKHKCVVEAVMSGSMVKVTILPSMEQIALRIAGVRSPVYVRPNQPKPKDGGKEQVSEPFGAEAQWTTERYTLHRDADIVFTGFDPDKEHKDKNEPVGGVYYGELFIKDHSIGEILLTSGLASFVEWSAPKDKVDKYRQLEEKSASSKQKIWSQPGKVSNTTQLTQADQSTNNSAASQGDKGKQPEAPVHKGSRSFNGRVKSVTNGALYVIEDLETPNHQARTITLSSIVVPKFGRGDRGTQ